MNGMMMQERAMPEMADGGDLDSVPSLEQCVPVAAVSVPDQDEQMAAPEPGDTVRYEVEGKVNRVAGGHVYVEPIAINGQPVEAKAEPVADDLAAMSEEAEGMGY